MIAGSGLLECVEHFYVVALVDICLYLRKDPAFCVRKQTFQIVVKPLDLRYHALELFLIVHSPYRLPLQCCPPLPVNCRL